MVTRKFIQCWKEPWLLDTPEKLKWANDISNEYSMSFEWKLGDHCWYKPIEAERMNK